MKNFDGIKKSKNPNLAARQFKHNAAAQVDGLVRRKIKPQTKIREPASPAIFVIPFKAAKTRAKKFIFLQKLYREKRVPVLAAVLALIIAFGGGMWSVFATAKSAANDQPEVLADSTSQPAQQNNSQPSGVQVSGSQIQSQSQDSPGINNNVLFNTPIQYLQNYFDSINQPDIINKRKNQLAQFLQDMHSPLAGSAEMIAEQSHWKLILAIAFAESTLGKNCADFNCSNIGIKPGSPIWHKYASYNDWVVDFNRLLDKRYNDWSLQQMCGVYVKPCTGNWLLATQQILDALNQQGIE